MIIDELTVLPLTNQIAEKSIEMRKRNKIKLADSITYATAEVHKRPLLTNNTSDFASLDDQVLLINPFSL